MKTDGKYRFNLGFSAASKEEIRAGELLESLGKKKSLIVVAALNEYMDRHPELTEGKVTLEIQKSGVFPDNLEAMIREMIKDQLSTVKIVEAQPAQEMPAEPQDADILDMISDLDIFK